MIKKVRSKEKQVSTGGLLIVAFLSIFSDVRLAQAGDDRNKSHVATVSEDGKHPLDDPKSVPPLAIGDASSTAIALWGGTEIIEKNPLYAWSGDAAPFLILPAYMIAKKILIKNGVDPAKVNLQLNAVGALGACNNVAVLLGASTGFGIALGLACALIYTDVATKDYVAHKAIGKANSEKKVQQLK